MSAQETAGDMHSLVESRLRRIDQRYTSGRRAIIELLVSVGHPVSIGDIAERLPDLPRTLGGGFGGAPRPPGGVPLGVLHAPRGCPAGRDEGVVIAPARPARGPTNPRGAPTAGHPADKRCRPTMRRAPAPPPGNARCY